ncbi:MAG: SAM-dependent methyltransferase [Propionibacteriales bacterium]|nr:SAM-dependent methyltransferase [Propionibacteriales bacterium]
MVPYRRVEVRYVDLAAGRRLQITAYDTTQSHTRNVAPGEPTLAAVGELVALPFSSWHVESSTETVQLRVTKKGRQLLHRSVPHGDDRADRVAVDRTHDRVKRRRLDESDPLFAALGMTTSDGRIKPSKMAKFRQVQDLLGVLDPVVDDAVALGPGTAMSPDNPLRLVDLGCGNAYLTFAAFRYLLQVKQLPLEGVGVDLKAQARAHNDDVASALGIGDALTFVEGTIGEAEVSRPPHLVLALHACDTATDDALARAVRWEAPVILAAPCCHHDIQRQIAAIGQPPDRYRLVTRHGILAERLADVLTDSLRAAILRILGYRVDVMEFVDSRHTPRNVVIRAVRTGAAPDDAIVAAYSQLCDEWGLRPALARRLVGLHPVLGRDL